MKSRRSAFRYQIAAIGCVLVASSCVTPDFQDHTLQEAYGLPEGVVAQIGSNTVSVQQIRLAATSNQIPSEKARDYLVFDLLLATEAVTRGFDQQPDFRVARRAILARALIDRLKIESKHGEVANGTNSVTSDLEYDAIRVRDKLDEILSNSASLPRVERNSFATIDLLAEFVFSAPLTRLGAQERGP